MLDAALFAKLTGASAVAALILTRAYPQKAPADATYPLLTYQQVTAGVDETRIVGGPVTHFRTIQQIDIYARTRAEAVALAKAVREAIDGAVNEMWGSVAVRAALFDQQFDAAFDADANLHRIIQQYRIAAAI